MNKFFLTALSAAVLSAGAVSAQNQNITLNPPAMGGDLPTGAYAPSRIDTKLNVEIKEGTKAVHFIRDNNDPSVVTRAYVIKNADPYVLRGVLKTIVAPTIAENPVALESIKYVDGSNVLLVSAEEYRFENAGNGMPMDKVIEMLDKKDLPNSSGTIDMAYFPKYNPASVLLRMMKESGMGVFAGSEFDHKAFTPGENGVKAEMLNYAVSDDQMNALIMTAPGYNMKETLNFLKEIDTPAGEVYFNYKLVEVYAENDQKLGLDFQAWKNNDGIDLFSAGGKYGTNWAGGLIPNNGYRFTEFYNFNPKWNTKYIDFLTTCGKAKVVSSGALLIANGGVASVALADGIFSVTLKDLEKKGILPTVTETAKGAYAKRINEPAVDKDGNPVTDADGNALTIGKIIDSLISEGAYAIENRNGKYQGTEAVDGGNLFQMNISGGVYGKAVNMNISLSSTSLIGWTGEGKARFANSNYATSVQVGKAAKDFVVGGITKTSVVRSVSGVPLLKNLPVLGWLFSTESDIVKKSQFVLVATVEAIEPDANMKKETKEHLSKITAKVNKAEKCPASTLGYQQLGLDSNN